MSQRITLPSYLRLTKDSLWLSRPCPMQARRQFSAYQKLNAGARMTMREQQMPARPSMATAQKMNMKDMRKQDIPEEMGMVRITYILPPRPSLFSNPRLRATQYYEFTKQFFTEWFQTIVGKYTFWRGIPQRNRPSHLKKSWMLFRPPRISLDTISHRRIIKDLHKRSYQAIQTAVETGDMTGIRETCGTSLQENYARMVHQYNMKRELVKWEVKYKPGPFGIRILSRKFGQVPIEYNGLPLGQQQVVARIASEQTLTPGRIVGKTREGEPDIEWGQPKTRKLTEHVIMARKYIEGRFEPWKIFSFKTPKGTAEELEAWREEQLRLPNQPGQRRAGAMAAA